MVKAVNWLLYASIKTVQWLAILSAKTKNWLAFAVPVTYATRNPSDKNANITLSGGNLIATAANTSWKSARANMGKSSWKRYWEIIPKKSSGGRNAMIGVWPASETLSSYVGTAATANSYYSYNWKTDPNNRYNNNTNLAYGAAYTLNDVIGVALDMDAWELTFYKNNVSQWTITWISGTMYPMVSPYDSWLYFETNFGATPLTYTPPTWFNAGLYS